MTMTRRFGRNLVRSATLVLAAVPLAVSTTALAVGDSVSLSVGPVPLPQLPVSACVDSSCVSTPPLTSVALTTTATVDHGPLPAVVLTPAACPGGGKGVAVSVTSLAPVTLSISGSVSGTTADGGRVTVPLGPVTRQLAPGTPGLVVSACTD